MIVQEYTQDGSLERLVARLGGHVTKNLPIINAFAELPAGAVPELAQGHGIRWISLDSPVVHTGWGSGPINIGNLGSVYPLAVNALAVWNTSPYISDSRSGQVSLEDQRGS